MHGGDSGDDEKFSTMHQNHYYLGGNVLPRFVGHFVCLSVGLPEKLRMNFHTVFSERKNLETKSNRL